MNSSQGVCLFDKYAPFLKKRGETMFCSECGCQMPDFARFCPRCGRAVRLNQPQFNAETKVTPNIILGSDGKFRWIYEMSLFKNPTIFVMIWKIFFFVVLGIFAFILLIDLINGDLDGEAALNLLKIFGYFVLGMTALVGISFLIYAAIMRGKYIVLFTMDEYGINHEQIPTQAKKAQGIADAAKLIGMLTGSHTAVTGGLAASGTSMYTAFSNTRKVRFSPRRDLIRIRQMLFRNQIYAKREDFGFVQSYILARVPDKAKPKKI